MAIKRRTFLKAAAALAAGVSLGATPPTVETRNGMPYRTLGTTGEQVSLLCLGGAHIGGKGLPEDEAIRIMRTAVDEGVNFFDNAWAYHGGQSERRMGKALKDGYRDKVFLMTKHKGRDAESAQKQLEDSLSRLEVDVIDLWQFHECIHEDDPKRIYSEGAIDVALKAQEEGKIRHIGFTGHKFPSVHKEMIERGFDWKTVQMPVNVLDHHFRSFEQEIMPLAVEKNIGIIAMKTCAGSTPGNIAKSGICTAADCLRYAMSQPVATVCSGMDSMAVLKENIATAKAFKPFEPEEIAALLEKSHDLAQDGAMEHYKTVWG